MRTIWFYLVFICYSISTSSAAFAGPYELIPLEFGKCEPSECEDSTKTSFSNYKIRKLDRNSYVFTGDFNTTINFDDEVKVKIDVSVWGNGGWKPNFYILDAGGVCSGMKKFIPGYLKRFETIINQTCPLPPGVYKLENISLLTDSPILPALPYGKYKNTIKCFDTNEKCVFCAKLILNCVPLRKKKP